MAQSLKPFRQYDEHDVINMFAYDVDATVTAGVQALASTIVEVNGAGFKASNDIHDISSSQPNAAVNNNGYNNTLSLRYNLVSEVVAFDGRQDGAKPLGMLLHDVRTLDENGEDLRYNPRKADEMQVVVPGQAVPVVTKGLFLLHDDAGTSDLANATPNDPLYATQLGGWTDTAGDINDTVIGYALGNWDTVTKTILVKLDL
jgi:hypothetical protein